jgi:putative transposase
VPERFLSEGVLSLREEFEERRSALRELVNEDLADRCREAVGRTLEELMEQERDLVLGFAPHQRVPQGQRPDHRNGHYHRDVVTKAGVLVGVAVPRSRRGSYQTQVLPRYQRRLAEVDDLIREAFLRGVSTRGAAQLAQMLTGESSSAQTVSRICQTLGPAVRAFHSRPLSDDLVYLYLDGLSMRIKGVWGVSRQMLLVAVGITRDGRRCVVDFQLVPRETKPHWVRFLEHLYLRGLQGAHLHCITTDGNPGLIAAVDTVYPWVPRQRCWVHKVRNVTNRLRQDQRAEAKAGMAKIYGASTRAQALAAFQEWYAHWHPLDAEAADCLRRDLPELLTVFRLPPAHRILMRTTNPLERAFVEVRRRSKLIPAFTDPASCERLCLSALGRVQASWDRKRLTAITQKT